MLILKTTLDCSRILPLLDIAKFALTVIQWAAPVLLILWGTLDLVRAVVAGKEDEIKKHQQVLIKRIISAVILFLIPMAVSLLLGLIGSTEWKKCWSAAKAQIISNETEYDARIKEYSDSIQEK